MSTAVPNRSTSAAVTAPTSATTTPPVEGTERYIVHFRSVGGAPALRQSKFPISGSRDISYIEASLKKMLGHDQAVYVYCGSGFAPNRSQTIAELYECFRTGDELTIFYGLQESWG